MIPMVCADIIGDEINLLRFEELYMAHRKEMLMAAYQVLQDYHEAEDAVQEALIGVVRNMSTVSRIAHAADLRLYLLRAARNAALNRTAAASRRQRDVPLDDIHAVSDGEFWSACAGSDYQRLLEIFAAMPEVYRQALYDHFVLGFTVREVAAALGIKHSAAKQRLVRGKKLLIQALEKEGYIHHVTE